MKHFLLIFTGFWVAVMVGVGSVDAAQPDSAYTGMTNEPTATAPVKHKKKVKKASAPAGSTNTVETPTPPAASTNAAASEVSPSASTNVVEPTEPSKPTTNAPVETEPEKPTAAASPTNAPPLTVAPPVPINHVATLSTTDLEEFPDLSPGIQALISHGLQLTKLNLKYQYGSADPQKGGMDCSGTVYYLLTQAGLKDVPRDASALYEWAWKEGRIQPVTSSNLSSFELDRLKPGDLLFWTGTYDVQRDPPISHVMIYLGTNRWNGHRVMVGASEGRTYENKARYGVSVFDLVLPKAASKANGSSAPVRNPDTRFIGYGPVPGL